MNKTAQEWFKQADHDMMAAGTMHRSGLYLQTVFQCHMSIEKALKGLYSHRTGRVPPKTHNIQYLVELLNVVAPPQMDALLSELTLLNIESRYPDNLDVALQTYDQTRTAHILQESQETLRWIEEKLKKF